MFYNVCAASVLDKRDGHLSIIVICLYDVQAALFPTGHNLQAYKMNYYSLHIGDYKSHTSHLSLLEDIAYRRMLDLYYLTESPLPSDVKKIARAICMRDNMDDIQTILDEFFIDTQEGFIHERCEREIKAVYEKSGKAKLSAQKRWNREKDANAMLDECERNANASNNHANASKTDANAMLGLCEGNAPNPNPNPNPNLTIGDFDVFWECYPNKTAKQAAVKAWAKLKPNDALFNTIMDALKKQIPHFKAGFIPYPATWLNGKRWEDEIPVKTEAQERANQPKPFEKAVTPENAGSSSDFVPTKKEAITEEEKARRKAFLANKKQQGDI